MSATTPLLNPQPTINISKKRLLSPRLISLITSTLTAITCSTPYIYSVYAPQLSTKCQFTSSESAKLSILLSCGSTFGGFPAGVFIDHFGPSLASLIGAFIGSGSFIMLWYCYQYNIHSVSAIGTALALSSFASIICFFASIKCVTANFPHHRGTAGAFPVSGYALGSLWYSWVAKFVSHDLVRQGEDGTTLLLIFVAVCMGFCCSLGSFGMKIHLKHESELVHTTNVTIQGQNIKMHRSDSVSSQLMDIFNTRRRSFTKYAMSYWGANRSPSMDSLSNDVPSQLVAPPQRSRPMNIGSVLSSSPVFTIGSPMSVGGTRKGSTTTKLGTLSSSLSQSRMSNYLQYQSNHGSSPAISVDAEEEVLEDFDISHSPASNSEVSVLKIQQSTPPLPSPPISSNYHSIQSKKNRPSMPYSLGSSSDADDCNDEEQYVAVEDTPIFVNASDPVFPSTLRSSIFSFSFVKHYIIVSFLIAGGQFYIYNVGFVVVTMVQSAHSNSGSLKDQITSAQSLQVSWISLFSFLGRFLSGPISDLISRKYKLQRLWGIAFGAIAMSMGHYSIGNVLTTVIQLSYASILIGFAFGFVFGTYPAIIADEFGTKLFTSLWGLITTGGIFVLILWNSLFAAEIQSHIPSDDHSTVGLCLDGVECFKSTFQDLAGVGCGVVCFILFVIWKENKKIYNA